MKTSLITIRLNTLMSSINLSIVLPVKICFRFILGLDFIVSNIWAATDKHQFSPLGFDIIFPGMIESANNIGLNLSLNQSSMKAMLLKQDLEIKRLFILYS